MRTRLTLQVGDDRRDVEIRAPVGTTLAELRAGLSAAAPAASGRSGDAVWWAGSRALPAGAALGGPGLRNGSVVGLDRPGPRDTAAQAVLRLHVVGGPDAGMIVAVPRGQLSIGRAPECDVRLSDQDVSRRHATLTMTSAGLTLHDLGSTNGSYVGDPHGGPPARIGPDGSGVEVGQYFTVGESVLCVAVVSVPPAATAPDDDGRLVVNRPPRLDALLPDRQVQLPEPPGSSRTAALPWLAAVLPALGGMGLAWFMHNPQFLAFALLSPVLMLGTALGDRLSGRRGRRRERADFRRADGSGRQARDRLLGAEADFRRRAHPDPAAVVHIASGPDARIWERRRRDHDFLQIRLGLGSQAAALTVRRGSLIEPAPILDSIPLAAALAAGPLGLCGPRPVSLASARWAVAQLCVLHSPADLSLVALLDDAAAPDWTWLRWLPHLRDPGGIAHDSDRRRMVVARLLELLDRRSDGTPRFSGGQSSSGADRRWSGPWTVVLIDRASTVTELPGLGRLLSEGAAVGISAICLDDQARRLPPSCATVAVAAGELGARLVIRTPTTKVDAVADRVTGPWADRIARALAPLADPGGETSTSLPREVRLLDLLELSDFQPRTIASAWARADGRARTVLGVSADGCAEVDLGRDGPHALVAGTTGAGKSELLQSLIAGLAVHASPQDLQFVLVDYKGGAAFAECARLPHTAGLVTDLDAQLTERALQSLDAELRRRELLFAAAGANDLETYRRASRPGGPPLGRLILVVDEFAALAEELPDFVTGLIGVAQRGRSLGVHLVLATQRPGGVVSPEIRANTALRIALRVTDPSESGDVVGCDHAADIDPATPGRAWLRTGQVLVQLQTARVGGPAPGRRPTVQILPLDAWGVADDAAAGAVAFSQPENAESENGQTDLRTLVEVLREAAALADVGAPNRPWLPPLPAVVSTADLVTEPRPSVIAVGLVDRPAEQAQEPLRLDLDAGSSVLLTGGPRSGRTTFLRTVAASAASRLDADGLHLYAIDCSGGALRPMIDLPQCGAVIGREDPAAIDRLLGRLGDEVARRQGILADLGTGSAAEARSRGHELPALLLLVDGWEGLTAATEDIDAGRPAETLLRLMRDAPAAVTVVLTGDRATLSNRVTGTVQRRLVLRMADPGDYAVAGLSRRAVPPQWLPGRAVDTGDAASVQLAVLDHDPSPAVQKQALAAVVRRCRTRDEALLGGSRPLRIRALPNRVALSSLVSPCPAGAVVLGVGGDDARPILVALAGTRARLMVAGPPRSGRSTVLHAMAVQLMAQAVPVVVAGARRGGRLDRLSAAAAHVSPGDGDLGREVTNLAAQARSCGRAVVILVDDCEAFLDGGAGEQLAELIRAGPPALSIVVAGRSDDLAVAYRGVGAEVRRARTGLLLQPGPGDGDLLGIRVPFGRSSAPPGRGLLVAPELLVPGAHECASTDADGSGSSSNGSGNSGSGNGNGNDPDDIETGSGLPVQVALA